MLVISCSYNIEDYYRVIMKDFQKNQVYSLKDLVAVCIITIPFVIIVATTCMHVQCTMYMYMKTHSFSNFSHTKFETTLPHRQLNLPPQKDATLPGVVACACNPATQRLGLEDCLRTGALRWAVLWEGVGQPGIMAKPNPYPCAVWGDQGCVRKGIRRKTCAKSVCGS